MLQIEFPGYHVTGRNIERNYNRRNIHTKTFIGIPNENCNYKNRDFTLFLAVDVVQEYMGNIKSKIS